MAGNNRQKKSSSPFSLFNIFKTKRYRKVEDAFDDPVKAYKVWPSDEDSGTYVAKPDIDQRATIFIERVRNQYIKETAQPTAAVSN